MAVQDQGHGIGIGLLKDDILRALMISDQAGIRAPLTHPMDDETARLYRRFGFEASPLREDQLLLVLKDARRMAAGSAISCDIFKPITRCVQIITYKPKQTNIQPFKPSYNIQCRLLWQKNCQMGVAFRTQTI